MTHEENILILDFGSQYTQLIARRIREQKIYSEIFPHRLELDKIKELNPAGIILSGGPMSVYDDDAPSIAVGLASGRWGALAAYGSRTRQVTKKIYGTRGNSFIAMVEFGDKVKAKSMLAGGQSGDPKSLHFDDQAQPYANRKFKDVAFYREDVEQRAEAKYHPGENY